jgi:purine-nucleoside phosphorylase
MLQRLAQLNIATWIVAGSGFAQAISELPADAVDEIAFAEIDGMPKTSVLGHRPVLRIVRLGMELVGVFMGRYHGYEGHDTQTTCMLVRIAHAYGGKRIVLTNACGGLSPQLLPGDVLLLDDGIDFTASLLPAHVSVQGSPLPRGALRQELFDREWKAQAAQRCIERGVQTKSGTYVQVLGPSFETRAEIRMLRVMGADVVGMSTIVEAKFAASIGMNVLGVSLVTNKATDTYSNAVSHAEVLDLAEHNTKRISTVLAAAL